MAEELKAHHYWREDRINGRLVVITPAEYDAWGKDNQPSEAYHPAFTRALLPSQGGEAVAWARQCDLDESDPAIFVAREEVQESGYVVPLYTHQADQVEDDLTMVKVSRELLERALKADASIGATAIQLADGWNAMAELRALLASAVDYQHS